MGIKKDEIFKEIRPKLPAWLSEEQRKEVLEEVGDYAVTTVLDYLGSGVSPVAGAGAFQKLTDEYAEKEKGGDNNPNMELNGDMLEALTYEVDYNSVKIGIWDPDQAIKAYGHITGFEGHPWLDGKVKKRKILPGDKEKFVSEMYDGIESIIEEYVEDARQDSEEIEGA